jgi:hypothetical protein
MRRSSGATGLSAIPLCIRMSGDRSLLVGTKTSYHLDSSIRRRYAEVTLLKHHIAKTTPKEPQCPLLILGIAKILAVEWISPQVYGTHV